MNIQLIITNKIKQAINKIGIKFGHNLQVHRSIKPQFGHYQIDGIITISKKLNVIPKKLAEKLIREVDLKDIADKIEVTDLGFINIFLGRKWLQYNIEAALKSPRFNITSAEIVKTVVIDYSSPNIAKVMHVGHIRSTIIGDSIARAIEFLGHNVIRINHIGDWGAQFGKLIALLKRKKLDKDHLSLSSLNDLYQEAVSWYNKDTKFAKYANECLAKLHNGNNKYLEIWQNIVDVTMSSNQEIYDRLNINLNYRNIMGESSYRSMLPDIVRDLQNKGIAIENDGAIIVPIKNIKYNYDNSDYVVIKKKDGSYLYSTIEIACIRYRCEQLKANRIIYCVDHRQHQHLIRSWLIARKAGYIPDNVSVEHHAFGVILDNTGKPLKTRTGEVINLSELLDEAVKRSRAFITKKRLIESSEKLSYISEIIGISTIKYNDLLRNRNTDYIFNWESALNLEGNTAIYIQYAHARACSLLRKANLYHNDLNYYLKIDNEYEVSLAVYLLQLEEIIIQVAHNGLPNILCTYTYNLTNKFSRFYEHCPILTANSDTRVSRLKLVYLTVRVIKICLEILGIKALDKI